MNLEIKTLDQKKAEQQLQIIAGLFSELTPEQRKEIVNYAIYVFNNRED